jgi:hypothetical protein
MLVLTHYGSTNETYKIAYSQQALTPRFKEYQFCQMRKLQRIKKRTYRLQKLWFLSRNESFGFGQKDRKETEERKGQKSRIKNKVISF